MNRGAITTVVDRGTIDAYLIYENSTMEVFEDIFYLMLALKRRGYGTFKHTMANGWAHLSFQNGIGLTYITDSDPKLMDEHLKWVKYVIDPTEKGIKWKK